MLLRTPRDPRSTGSRDEPWDGKEEEYDDAQWEQVPETPQH
jgi:hypothetical protein